jgi:hypothetical protein
VEEHMGGTGEKKARKRKEESEHSKEKQARRKVDILICSAQHAVHHVTKMENPSRLADRNLAVKAKMPQKPGFA